MRSSLQVHIEKTRPLCYNYFVIAKFFSAAELLLIGQYF